MLFGLLDTEQSSLLSRIFQKNEVMIAEEYDDTKNLKLLIQLFHFFDCSNQKPRSFTVIGPLLWNHLPPASRNTFLSSNLSTSLALLKTCLFLGTNCTEKHLFML